jgi:hypothetical protein
MSEGPNVGGWRPHPEGVSSVLKLLMDAVKATSTEAHSEVTVQLEKMKQHPEFNVRLLTACDGRAHGLLTHV